MASFPPFAHPTIFPTNSTETTSSNQQHSTTMPTYRGITLTLHSQFDILPLPEYAIPPGSPLTTTEDADLPHVLAPFLPGSHFWLSYAIAPPVPVSQFFLFKMRIDGKKVVSWCAGGEEGYEGKVVCGLFEGGDGSWVERRAFRFAIDGCEGEGGRCIEVNVHRAGGRRRVPRRTESWCEGEEGERGGIELVPAGRAGPEQPKCFYEFALIDPVDRPFAEFRFHYRSWEQLDEVGVLYKDEVGHVGEENALPVIEPGGSHVGGDEEVIEEVIEEDRRYAPATTLHGSTSIDTHDGLSAPNSYRLSFPPKVTLNPFKADTRALPSIPRKNSSPSLTAYHPHPAYPVDDWTLRTPSPVQSARSGLRAPPLMRGKGFLGTLKDWKKNLSGASAKDGKQ